MFETGPNDAATSGLELRDQTPAHRTPRWSLRHISSADRFSTDRSPICARTRRSDLPGHTRDQRSLTATQLRHFAPHCRVAADATLSDRRKPLIRPNPGSLPRCHAPVLRLDVRRRSPPSNHIDSDIGKKYVHPRIPRAPSRSAAQDHGIHFTSSTPLFCHKCSQCRPTQVTNTADRSKGGESAIYSIANARASDLRPGMAAASRGEQCRC